jgi:hypothetical protein
VWALDVEEMESFSKKDLRDVSWWKSIKDIYKPRVLIIARLSKEWCIFLVVKGRPFALHVNMTEACVGPLQVEKNIISKRVY